MHRRRERGRKNHTPEADHGPGKQIILFLPAGMDNLGQRKFFEGFVFSTIESLAQNLITHTNVLGPKTLFLLPRQDRFIEGHFKAT